MKMDNKACEAYWQLKDRVAELKGDITIANDACKELGDDRIRLIKERDKLKEEVERLKKELQLRRDADLEDKYPIHGDPQ